MEVLTGSCIEEPHLLCPGVDPGGAERTAGLTAIPDTAVPRVLICNPLFKSASLLVKARYEYVHGGPIATYKMRKCGLCVLSGNDEKCQTPCFDAT